MDSSIKLKLVWRAIISSPENLRAPLALKYGPVMTSVLYSEPAGFRSTKLSSGCADLLVRMILLLVGVGLNRSAKSGASRPWEISTLKESSRFGQGWRM